MYFSSRFATRHKLYLNRQLLIESLTKNVKKNPEKIQDKSVQPNKHDLLRNQRICQIACAIMTTILENDSPAAKRTSLASDVYIYMRIRHGSRNFPRKKKQKKEKSRREAKG